MTFVNNVSLREGTRVSGWLCLVHCGITIWKKKKKKPSKMLKDMQCKEMDG